MRGKWLIIFLLLLATLKGFAIRAIFDYKVFHHPTDGAYVECITSFEGATFSLEKIDTSSFKARAELMIVISQNEKIVSFRKLQVEGPLVSANNPEDFLSLERFLLPNGIYDVELEIRDLVGGGEPASLTKRIVIENPLSGVFVSDIEFLSAYRKTTEITILSKAGYDMIPYLSGYYPNSANIIVFYSEIYRTDEEFGKDEPFVYVLKVMDRFNREIESISKMKREKSSPVVSMLQTLDISTLSTGEYKLRVEVRNKLNEMLYFTERKFSRTKQEDKDQNTIGVADIILSNSFASKYTDRDALYKLIEAHLPIANELDRITITNQLKVADLTMLQSFLYSFWMKKNPTNPESAWLEYEKQIKEVDLAFGNGKKPGWRTDRGRVYLQYGPPNTRVMRHNETNYFPFEIWHYYETNDKQHNRRFLFYSTDLTMDMELLHSDVPSEVKNYQWREMVRSRPTALNMGEASQLNAGRNNESFSREELEKLWATPY